MKTIEVRCEYCGESVTKPLKEYIRSLKRGRKFFCNNSCGAKYSNEPRKAKVVTKACELCFKQFNTTNLSEKRFCSQSCASAGSVTDKRREAARTSGNNSNNLNTPAQTLRSREAWKYVELDTLMDEPHEFEYPVGEYVFDLYLPERHLLIEFDGKDHGGKTLEADELKSLFANTLGFEVKRIRVESNTVIPISALEPIGYARQQLLAA